MRIQLIVLAFVFLGAGCFQISVKGPVHESTTQASEKSSRTVAVRPLESAAEARENVSQAVNGPASESRAPAVETLVKKLKESIVEGKAQARENTSQAVKAPKSGSTTQAIETLLKELKESSVEAKNQTSTKQFQAVKRSNVESAAPLSENISRVVRAAKAGLASQVGENTSRAQAVQWASVEATTGDSENTSQVVKGLKLRSAPHAIENTSQVLSQPTLESPVSTTDSASSGVRGQMLQLAAQTSENGFQTTENATIESELEMQPRENKTLTSLYDKWEPMTLKWEPMSRPRKLSLFAVETARTEWKGRTSQIPGTFDQWQSWSEMIHVRSKNFMFCAVPKSACTLWKQLLLRASGSDHWNTTNSTYIHHPVLSGLDLVGVKSGTHTRDWRGHNESDILALLDPASTVTSAAIVRDPVTRILSSYLDRLIDNKEWWRVNASRYIPFSQAITNLEEKGTKDVHFKNQTDMCGLRYMTYSFLGHFEKLREDSRRILEAAGLWEDYGQTGWGPNGKAPFAVLTQLISNHKEGHDTAGLVCKHYTPRLLKRVYQLYKPDFELFNYSIKTWRNKCRPQWLEAERLAAREPQTQEPIFANAITSASATIVPSAPAVVSATTLAGTNDGQTAPVHRVMWMHLQGLLHNLWRSS